MRCFPFFIVWQRPKLLLYWKFETDILENRKMRQKHFDLPFTFFLSCFRTNCGRTFQSHFYNFAKCQTLLPLKHIRLVSFEYKACNFYFIQYLQGKSTNFPRYRKYFVSNAIFHDHPRETIYIFLFNSPWLHKMSRQHWSTQLQDAGVPDFFFPCLQDLF